MRDVAVTEGDKVEAHIGFGWQVDYYPIGDLVEYIEKVTDKEVDAMMGLAVIIIILIVLSKSVFLSRIPQSGSPATDLFCHC